MTYPGLAMWNGSSKIQYFIDIWNSFCWRLWRPWMLLSTKSKGHKSNFRISGMYRFCFYDLNVHFWWPDKCSKHQILRLNTLYINSMDALHAHMWYIHQWTFLLVHTSIETIWIWHIYSIKWKGCKGGLISESFCHPHKTVSNPLILK